MQAYLEHANITVSSLDAAIEFITTAFPHWDVRHRGTNNNGTEWLHIGTDDVYIAYQMQKQAEVPERMSYAQVGVNHIGFVVDDAQALHQRLKRAGYREGITASEHPHRRRVYFFDGDGNEYEFVEYFSDKPGEKNDYSL